MGKTLVAYSPAGWLLMATLPGLAVAQRQDRAQSICAYYGQEKNTESISCLAVYWQSSPWVSVRDTQCHAPFCPGGGFREDAKGLMLARSPRAHRPLSGAMSAAPAGRLAGICWPAWRPAIVGAE